MALLRDDRWPVARLSPITSSAGFEATERNAASALLAVLSHVVEFGIRSKADEGHSARLNARFCRPWSNPNPHAALVPDVRVGAWQIPWNAKPDAGCLAPGIPPSNFWASDPNGLDQVGCVYTAQGFEFDYVGVIWGRDLRWDRTTTDWMGDSGVSHDVIVKRSGDRFTDLVKRTYRVLLTRGLKGCYLYFEDVDSRSWVARQTTSSGQIDGPS